MKSYIKQFVSSFMVIVMFLTTALVTIPTQAAYAAPEVCWCTKVTAEVKGLTADFGDANTWKKGYLQQNGYIQTSAPVVGDIVTFDHLGTSGPAYTAGHVGVIDKIDDEGSYWHFNIIQNIGRPGNDPNNAKNGSDVQGNKYWTVGNCSNVGVVMYARRQKSDTSIQYWHKGPSEAKLIVSQALSLSTTTPMVNTGVTATFKVKNIGGAAMTLQSLSAGSRRGADWNGVNTDFPAAANIVLQPGQEYSYQQSRSFDTAGAYFAEPVVLIDGKWSGIPGLNGEYFRVNFNVTTGIVTPPPPNTVFQNGVSKLWQDGNYYRANLTITANNLKGQNICVRFWRVGREFKIVCKVADSNSITFWDLDLDGYMNRTTYYSQAAMNQNPNPNWPAPGCAGVSGGQGLCDSIRRP